MKSFGINKRQKKKLSSRGLSESSTSLSEFRRQRSFFLTPRILKYILLSSSILISVIAVILALAIMLLNTDIAQGRARRVINGMIPGSIAWGYLDISPARGRVEIRNAVLSGEDRRPIARFDRLTVRVAWWPALRGKLDIVVARLEKPEVFLELDKEGRLNIVKALGIPPSRKKPDSKAGRLPGFLTVRRCVLDNGRFGFARPAENFKLDLQNIRCAAGLDFAGETGTIELAIGNGYLAVKNRTTDLKHCSLDSAVRRGIAERLRLKLQTTASEVSVRGEIRELFRNPAFDVNARFSLSLTELRDILNASRPLDGTVTGALAGRGTVNNPSISFTARYSGGNILGSAVDSISADMTMEDRVVSIAGIRAFSGAGYLDLRGSIDMRNACPAGFTGPGHDTGRISYVIALTSRGFSVRSIPGLAGAARGLIDSDCTLSGTGFAPASASTDLAMKATVMNFSIGEKENPGQLSLRARAAIRGGILRVSDLEALLGSARLQAGGSYTTATKGLQASFSLASPDIATEAASLGFGNCGGKLNAGGSLSGTIRRPVVTAGLTGSMVRFRGIMIGDMAAHASLDETGRVTIDRFTLTNNESKVSLTGGAGLFEEGTFTMRPDPPISLNIDKFEVDAGDFLDRYAGRLSLAGHLAGSLRDPAGLLAVTGDGIDLGFQKFQALHCSVNFKERKARIDPLLLTVAPGEAIRCSGWIGTDRAYEFSLDSDPISFAGIQAIDTAGGLRGRIALELKGSGSLHNPSMQGSVAATRIAFKDTAYDDMTVKLTVRNRRVTVKGNLNFDIDGTYDFARRRFMIAALFNRTDLAPLLSAAGRKNLGGTVSGTIRAEGSAASPERSGLDIRLSRLELFSDGERLVRSAMFDARLKGGVLAIPGINLALLDSGWIRIGGGGNIHNAFTISLDGSIPLDLANRFTDNPMNFSGTLALKGGIAGTWPRPHAKAEVRLDNIGFSIPAINNDVRGLNGRILFAPGRVIINDIHGLMGQGRFGIKGSMGMRGLDPVDIRVDAAARNIPVEIPDMMNLTFDADARITGAKTRAVIRGNFTLLDGIYYRDLALHPLQDIGKPADRVPGTLRDASRKTVLDTTAIDVTVFSKRPFAIDNNIATLKISTDLRMTGTLRKPLLGGGARVESGVVHYLGRDFDITRGKIDFINPYRIEPMISIRSSARIQKWLVSIAVTGTPATLKYELSSSPMLDSNNILSLVMLGKTTGGSMTYSYSELLGQMIAFNYGGRIKKSTGIDSIEVKARDPRGRGSSGGQVVTIGKNLDRRFSVYYSIGKESREIKTGTAVKYRLNDSMLLNLDYDSKGKIGIDMQYNKEFR